MRETWVRGIYLFFGVILLAVGLVGAIVPAFPGGLCIIAALWLLSKGSEKIHDWLLYNRWFGHYLRNLKERKGLTLKSKIIATSSISISTFLSIFFIKEYIILKILMVLFAGVIVALTVSQPTLKSNPS